MAHHASAKKATRQTLKRTEENTQRKSRVRTFVKKVTVATAAGQRDQALEALRTAESEMARAVRRGIYKQGYLRRVISKLTHKIKAIA